VIPVKNGEATLYNCLESIRNQTMNNQLEIIVLDSMSTDNSVEIAKAFGAKIVTIPAGDFIHGLTRNLGVQSAKGEFIYLSVQDARIAKNNMLENMIRHFEDKDIKAVVGHQAVAHEQDKNPFLWYKPISEPAQTVKWVRKPQNFKALSINEQQSLASWDNVVAMYRQSALLEQPFVKTDFAEDWIWGYQAMLQGWKLLHDSSLVVYHYHHHSFRYAFNSRYTINYHFYKFFRCVPALPPLIMPNIRAMYHLLKNKKLSLRERFYWTVHNWSARTAGYLSTFNFLLRLKTGGDNAIEKGYNKYCKVIPQGKQK
jgi:rhamnosyltransferase